MGGLRRGQQNFKASKGVGLIDVKCESMISASAEQLDLKLTVGEGAQSSSRDFVTHDFSAHPVARLPSADADWDFQSAMNPVSQTVLVALDMKPVASAHSHRLLTRRQTWEQRRHLVLASMQTSHAHAACVMSGAVLENGMEQPLASSGFSAAGSHPLAKSRYEKQHERRLRRLRERALRLDANCSSPLAAAPDQDEVPVEQAYGAVSMASDTVASSASMV